MICVLSQGAERELLAALAYYKQNASSTVAKDFLAAFQQKAQLIAEFPEIGRASVNGRRLVGVGKYPFSILYQSEGDKVRIVAIAHHRRGPEYWERWNRK